MFRSRHTSLLLAPVQMNMYQAINNAMDLALGKDPKTVLFGEDVAFGGVFRCSQGLQEKYGQARVFNTPLTEQGIAGFAIGLASNGWRPIAEIQFADYIFPAFDQLVNEAAKYRYRSGNQFHCGGLTVRAPCSAVGHGGLYHSQTPEAYFAHTPGIKVVMPSTPTDAKGLLLACIEDNNPCLFLEPKILYRTAVEVVEEEHFIVPIGKAKILQPGSDLTVISYGSHLRRVLEAVDLLKQTHPNKTVEVIDLRTIVPYDAETLITSVKKTGRFLVTHEAPTTCGFGSELVAELTKECFLHLEAPPTRLGGLDTPFPLIHEKVYLPNPHKICDAMKAL
eukprot:PhF_6_TR13884/c0_g1_i2/m.22296/K00167/BCKDHB, bkdA2; 2-oxoisovalerate dehydrogenase E1 component beta subunit